MTVIDGWDGHGQSITDEMVTEDHRVSKLKKKNSIRKILIINFPLESQVSEIFIVYSLRPTHGLKAGLTFDADHESFFRIFLSVMSQVLFTCCFVKWRNIIIQKRSKEYKISVDLCQPQKSKCCSILAQMTPYFAIFLNFTR